MKKTLANLDKRHMACVITLDGKIQYSIGDDPVDTVEEAEKQIADYMHECGTHSHFTILPIYH